MGGLTVLCGACAPGGDGRGCALTWRSQSLTEPSPQVDTSWLSFVSLHATSYWPSWDSNMATGMIWLLMGSQSRMKSRPLPTIP
jgi:hypothetical protein